MSVLTEERKRRIVGGLDTLAARGLLGTEEAADLTARILRLGDTSAPEGAPGAVPGERQG